MGLPRNYIVIRRIQTMAKEMTKETKPKRKTKLERTTEAQLFIEQDELQKQLEAEELNTKSTPAEVHVPHIVRRLRKL